MSSLIKLAEHEIAAGWKWVETAAVTVYHALEPILADAFKVFEASVVQSFWGAAAALVQRLLGVKDLADLETAFLNTLSHLGGQVLAAAQTLGSAILQSLLGLLQGHAKLAA